MHIKHFIQIITEIYIRGRKSRVEKIYQPKLTKTPQLFKTKHQLELKSKVKSQKNTEKGWWTVPDINKFKTKLATDRGEESDERLTLPKTGVSPFAWMEVEKSGEDAQGPRQHYRCILSPINVRRCSDRETLLKRCKKPTSASQGQKRMK